MTPEEKKLQKLQQILSIADQDYVTTDDFKKAVDLLVAHIKGAVGVNDTYKKEFVKYCEQEVKDARNDIEGAKTDCKKALEELVKKANSLKNGKDGRDGHTPVKGVDYFDGKDGAKGDKGDAGDIKELSPDEIRDALEILEGDDRLDKSAVKGLDEIERMAKLNAVPVTTSFINGQRAKNIHVNGATVSVQGDTAYVTTAGGGGAVDSVNGATGVVVLDADDIDDTATTNKFVVAGDVTKLGHISVTQAVDLDALETASHAAVTVTDTAEIDLSLTGQALSASIVAGSIDETKLDASVNTSLDLADTSVQPGDGITDLNATAWRVFYSNTTGDVTELALGADGTFLKSNGASSAPSFAVPAGSGGGITRTVTTSSGAFTAGATADTDYVYLIAGAHAVALPTAVGNTNRYTFKNNHSAAITITPDGVETVEGGATLSLNPLASVDLISNNSVWFVI